MNPFAFGRHLSLQRRPRSAHPYARTLLCSCARLADITRIRDEACGWKTGRNGSRRVSYEMCCWFFRFVGMSGADPRSLRYGYRATMPLGRKGAALWSLTSSSRRSRWAGRLRCVATRSCDLPPTLLTELSRRVRAYASTRGTQRLYDCEATCSSRILVSTASFRGCRPSLLLVRSSRL